MEFDLKYQAFLKEKRKLLAFKNILFLTLFANIVESTKIVLYYDFYAFIPK